MDRERVFRVLGGVCLVFAVGLITVPGQKGVYAYSAEEVPDGYTTEEPAELTALPADQRRVAERLIDGERFTQENYHLHPFGYEFTITRIDGSWHIGTPSKYQQLPALVTHNNHTYGMLPKGFSDGQVNPVPFWLGGGVALIGGTLLFNRGSHSRQQS
jgi:hypothetical protein